MGNLVFKKGDENGTNPPNFLLEMRKGRNHYRWKDIVKSDLKEFGYVFTWHG